MEAIVKIAISRKNAAEMREYEAADDMDSSRFREDPEQFLTA
jgi:hypothetical protein